MRRRIFKRKIFLIAVKIQISLIVDNADNIKTKNIILNAEIAEVNFVRVALKMQLIFRIFLVHYVERNFQEGKEI